MIPVETKALLAKMTRSPNVLDHPMARPLGATTAETRPATAMRGRPIIRETARPAPAAMHIPSAGPRTLTLNPKKTRSRLDRARHVRSPRPSTSPEARRWSQGGGTSSRSTHGSSRSSDPLTSTPTLSRSVGRWPRCTPPPSEGGSFSANPASSPGSRPPSCPSPGPRRRRWQPPSSKLRGWRLEHEQALRRPVHASTEACGGHQSGDGRAWSRCGTRRPDPVDRVAWFVLS